MQLLLKKLVQMGLNFVVRVNPNMSASDTISIWTKRTLAVVIVRKTAQAD